MTITATATNDDGEQRGANRIIGERVHQAMWRGQVTQTALGPVLGMTQSALSAKLRGRRAFTADEILYVADIFGVSLDYLYGRADDPRPFGPNGERLDVVDPGRIELPTSCLQTRHLAEVIPLRRAS